MTINYTTLLGLAQPVTGTESNVWGDAVNDQITALLDSAIAGAATISVTAGNVTLTDLDGAADQARMAILILTGTPGTTRNVVAPSRSKTYIVVNQSDASAVVKGSATTGVTVRSGQAATCVWNGTDFEIVASGDVDGPASATNTAVPTFDGTTGKLIQNNSGVTIAANVVTATGFTGALNGTLGATTPATVVATQVDITAQGDLRLQDTTGGQYVALQAPATVATSYTLTLPVDDGTAGQALITDGSGVLSWSTAASGDVYGPASATDNAVARYDGTTGKIIQNSAVTIADDGATVIAVNSASDGLRITQIGAGNALVVEDSANPDASPTVITASGQVVIGSTTALTYGGFSGSLQINSASQTSLQLSGWQTTSSAPPQFVFARSASGTVGTNGAVVSGSDLGAIRFLGDDGATFIPAATILAEVDGTPGTNDMPGRLVFSTTADGDSTTTERVRISSSGGLGIGGSPTADVPLLVAQVGTAINMNGVRNTQVTPATATASHKLFQTVASTVASAFTLPNLTHYEAFQSTIGAGSTVTSQYGFFAQNNLIGATNNYGFYSAIASGTGRYNFYAAGTADNYMAGALGIGATTLTGFNLRIGRNLTGSVNAYGSLIESVTQSDVTSASAYYATNASTAAAAFTTSALRHYQAVQGTIGAGSTVTTQFGFFVDSTLIGATTNYGFFSNIASGTGRYNFYANGTADNYFAGNVGVGTTTMSQKLNVTAINTTGFAGQRIQNNNTNIGIAGVEFSSDSTYAKAAIGLTRNQANGGGILSIYNSASAGAANWATTDAKIQIAFNGTISLGAAIGSESLRVTPIASAVNRIEVLGASTGLSPVVKSVGSDTNINAVFATQGTGAHLFRTNGDTANTQFQISHTASAVNYFTAYGSATGNSVLMDTAGSDTNVSAAFRTKGTGDFFFYTGDYTRPQFRVTHTASAVNYLQATGAATGGTPVLSVAGSDTNVSLVITSQAAGNVQLRTGTGGQIQFLASHTASAVNYLQVTGAATGGIPFILAQGSDTDVSARYGTKGNGFHAFFTNSTGSNTQFLISNTASAINYLQVTGAASGAPAIRSNGSDTNIGIDIFTKGTGAILLRTDRDGAASTQFRVEHTASAINYLQVTGSASTTPTLSALGSGADLDILLTPKGTGNVRFGTHTAGVVAQSGYITIKDAAGTTRRLLVG